MHSRRRRTADRPVRYSRSSCLPFCLGVALVPPAVTPRPSAAAPTGHPVLR
jgi:hypothetical protein